VAGRRRKAAWNPWDDEDLEVRRIQPYQAIKAYTCPGCNQTIPPGLGHYVVVPVRHPDDRGHWHRGCWDRRVRRPTR
jgi:hypothetical protein